MSASPPPPSGYAGYVFDLDGTLYLGEDLLPGADRVVRVLRKAERRVAFLSNKPIGSPAEYAAKLTALGLPASAEEVITSPVALRLHLTQTHPGAQALVIGEDSVTEELTRGGLSLTDDPQQAQVVVVSWDRQVTYARLDAALQALRRGAYFAATNPDVTCPLPGGGHCLDAGSFIALLEAASGRQVQAVAGKPAGLMLDVILSRWGLRAAQCLVVGDRLETDLEFGKQGGAATAVVLTGVATREAIAAYPVAPDYVLPSVADLLTAAAPEAG